MRRTGGGRTQPTGPFPSLVWFVAALLGVAMVSPGDQPTSSPISRTMVGGAKLTCPFPVVIPTAMPRAFKHPLMVEAHLARPPS